MSDDYKLYETLGELMYVVAKADGIIQKEEVSALQDMLVGHPFGKEIKWSFDYEKANNSSVEEVYKKVIDFCQHYGPSARYEEFIDAMNIVAKSSVGIDANEEAVINSFSADLIAKFQKDIQA